MTDSVTIQALERVIAVLNEDRPTGVPQVTKRRTFPGEEIKAARMAVFLGDETIAAPMGSSNQDPLARRVIPIAVQCACATDDVEAIDALPDPMLNWATAKLGKTRLEGLVHYVRESATTRRVEHLSLYQVIATCVFEMSYQTRRNDRTRT